MDEPRVAKLTVDRQCASVGSSLRAVVSPRSRAPALVVASQSRIRNHLVALLAAVHLARAKNETARKRSC